MKKVEISKVLIYATFAFLLMLLVVQISWISQVAQLEERLFNNRVELALVNVKGDLEEDVIAAESMKESMKETMKISNKATKKQITDIKAQKKQRLSRVDQLLKENLLRYNIKLDYDFDLINNKEAARQKSRILSSKGWYYTSLENILIDEGIQLKIKFPSRDQFLLSKLIGMFLISALLIFAVTISFIIMLRFYSKEHQLAKKTRDFVNNMTHEMNTPLANIGLANNLAIRQVGMIKNEKLNHYLQIIQTEKSKLQSLTDDILTVAILENVNKSDSFEDLDMHALITNVSQDSILPVDDKCGIIELDLQATNCHIAGNHKRMTNVLTNLIDNSLKYSLEEPAIKISTFNRNKQFIFSVKDNGIGIKNEDLKHVTEKYYRVSSGNVHNIKGFGLGLTFIKLVVEEHNGKMNIKSKPGQGTEVEISIPIIN